MKTQKVFLVGSTGFIGAEVLRALAGRPDVEVMALVRSAASQQAVKASGATPVPGDLAQPGPWQQAMAEADVVIHSAQPATFGQRVGKAQAQAYEAQRLALDASLLAALPRQHRARLLYVAGNSYYGETGAGQPLDERMAPRPTGFGPYITQAVQSAEALANDQLEVVVAFPGAVYGMGSWLKQYFIDPIAAGKRVMRVAGPAHWASPVHVADAGAAIAHLALLDSSQLSSPKERFFVVDQQPVTYDDIAAAVADALGKPLKTRSIPGWLLGLFAGEVVRSYMQTDSKYSSAKLQRTGFVHKYPTLSKGLPSLIKGTAI